MKRAHLWPIGIVVVLGITVIANLWVMRVASADPSFAIEPDYYAQAVRWDSTLAQGARNRALGWSLQPTFARDPAGGVELTAIVVDREGRVIHDASVQVTAFAVARSAQRVDVQLRETAEGYRGTLAAHRAIAGRWELQFDVRRGDQRLTTTQRLELEAP